MQHLKSQYEFLSRSFLPGYPDKGYIANVISNISPYILPCANLSITNVVFHPYQPK